MRQNRPMTDTDPTSGNPEAERERRAATWVADCLNRDHIDLQPVSGDASFRRYFRCQDGKRSLIVMDAPPERENSASFIDIAARLRESDLLAPEIYHFDLDLGFGLLEDFGDTLYRELLSANQPELLMPDLFAVLAKMTRASTDGLPIYHGLKLQQEMSLFPDWYLRVHRHYRFSHMEYLEWNRLCAELIKSAQEQPQAFVHRDFHSCNVLRTPDAQTGIIDFQDAVLGPLNYDLVSLLWDRYIEWPRSQLETWMMAFHHRLDLSCHPSTWIRWCDLMGLQRNLKIVGIFARLRYRDDKQGYVEMIPRFYQYLLDVTGRYPEFGEFHRILEKTECAP